MFIAVGTPQVGGVPDLTAVRAVASGIGKAIDQFKVIVMKSTVPIGTTEEMGSLIRSCTDKPFGMISNPEFLKEGAALDDFMKPDRVVIGAEDDRAADIVRELYAPFVSDRESRAGDRHSHCRDDEVRFERLSRHADFVHERLWPTCARR